MYFTTAQQRNIVLLLLSILQFANIAVSLAQPLKQQQQDGDAVPVLDIDDIDADRTDMIPHGNHFHSAQENDENSGYVLLMLMSLLGVFQVSLVAWHRKYPASYDTASLIALWLIPLAFAFSAGFYIFIFVWSVFSVASLYMLWIARARPLAKHTPRNIYSFMFFSFASSYWTAALGYFCVMSDIVGISLFLPEAVQPLSQFGILLLWYGLYFGTLLREYASLATTLMTVGLGYGGKHLMPVKPLGASTCAICDDALPRFAHVNEATSTDKPAERVLTLNCGHVFHEFCLRGFLLVGKKDHCALCGEKVSTRELFLSTDPWRMQQYGFSRALDLLRVLVVFLPTFTFFSQHIIERIY